MAYATASAHQAYTKTNTTQDDDGEVTIWVRMEHANMAFEMDEARLVLRDLEAAIKDGERRIAERSDGSVHCNNLDQFIREHLIHHKGATVLAATMYDAYLQWCRAEQLEPLSRVAIGKGLSARGWEKDKINGVLKYKDASLKTSQGDDNV